MKRQPALVSRLKEEYQLQYTYITARKFADLSICPVSSQNVWLWFPSDSWRNPLIVVGRGENRWMTCVADQYMYHPQSVQLMQHRRGEPQHLQTLVPVFAPLDLPSQSHHTWQGRSIYQLIVVGHLLSPICVHRVRPAGKMAGLWMVDEGQEWSQIFDEDGGEVTLHNGLLSLHKWIVRMIYLQLDPYGPLLATNPE